MKKLLYFLLCATLLIPFSSQAQFKKLLNKTTDKIVDGAVDKATDAVAQKLAYEALKPVNKVFDDWVRESYEAEYGTEIDPEKQDSIFQAMGSSYAKFLEGMNKSVTLPESFAFHVSMRIETEDYDDNKSEVTMLFSNTDPVFAVRQDQDGKDQTVLMNMKDDYIVLYSLDDKGVKRGQTISGVFGAAAMMTRDKMEAEYKDVKIEGPGKKKTFFGKYDAYEYKGETEEYKFKYFFSKDLPINWENAYGGIMKRFSPNAYNQMSQQVEGMIIEGETEKKDGKQKSKWTTREIKEEVETIKNSEWKFEGMGEN